MSKITFSVRNFRALERLDWAPEGVCVLSGANGAGKTTTLDAFRFLRTLFERGHEAALVAVDGVAFARWEAADALVEFSVTVGELVWKLRFPMSAQGMKGHYGEELYRDGALVLRAAMFEDGWLLGDERLPRDELRCCARVLWDRGTAPWMRPLVDALGGLRVYGAYWLNQVRQVQPTTTTSAFLSGNGRNLWAVLANWKASPLKYRGQYDWVLGQARRAFPGLIDSVEFEHGFPSIFRPGVTDPAGGLPPARLADGLLTGLLHLTAVAGAPPGSLIAFDELENQLHPHAIRALLAAMREQAEQRGLTIVLTTHSPVVLNELTPDRVYVLGAGDRNPAPLDTLREPAWLAMFALGDLYERSVFGAPERSPV